MPPGWQLSVWITSLAGKHAILDDLMGILASNYFTPAILAIVLLCVWLGTRDDTQREHNQRTLTRVGVGVALAFVVVVAFNMAQSAWGNIWERPYVNHPEAADAMNLLYWPLEDSSFPSNAITGIAAAATGLWLINRRASLLCWALVTIWGLGRVYVGIHYPIDIAGGMLIGFICCITAVKLIPEDNPLSPRVINLVKRLFLA